ncbi:MAG: enoyl-CoA hydratase [Thermoleophilaceae bacterium]|nr:enoyl-CoA hydratase [Thermoleophilaceae bacterium]
MASGKLVVDEPAPNVLRIRISNPDKRGALDHEILDTLRDTVAGAGARCLLITGDGPVFSAGYDIGNFNDEGAFADAAEKLVAHPFVDAMDAIEAYPYPVVAALNGHAIGGGLELAVTCDLRIAARGIKLGMPPAKIGLIYGHTGLRRFIDVCGVAGTNELFLVGRNVDSDRAYEMGLVNRVVEPDQLEETAFSLAAEIGANSPLSLSGNKRIIRTLRDYEGKLPDDVERELVDLRESCFRTDDFREGISAFGEKRKPDWKGR